MALSDDEIRAEMRKEIAEARRILAEDGTHVRLSAIEAKLAKHFPDEPEPAEPPDPNAPPPPPPHEPKEPATQARKSGWWPDGSLDQE